jgi:hypothetical protein
MNRKTKKRLWWIGITAGTAVLIVGSIVIYLVVGRRADRDGPGRLQEAHVVRTADGKPRLLIINTIQVRGWGRGHRPKTEVRLDLLDPRTGRRVHRRQLGQRKPIRCLASRPGRIWCRSRYRADLEVRDAGSLKVVASLVEIRRRNPGQRLRLAKAYYGRIAVDPRTRDAIVETTDNNHVRIQAQSLRATAVTGLPRDLKPPPVTGGGGPTVTKVRLGAGTLEVVGNTLQLDLPGRERRAPFAPKLRAIYGAFLGDYVTREAIRPADGKGALVLHRTGTDPRNYELQLTAVAADQRVLWTIRLGEGPLALAYRLENRLILALQAKKSFVLAVDLRSGKVLWRYRV